MIEIIAGGRGVRMDICFEDDEKALYNLEMQNSNEGDLPRRSRYYQSLMDLAMSERGMEYDQLGEAFVVSCAGSIRSAGGCTDTHSGAPVWRNRSWRWMTEHIGCF